jgi:hypothetical protein
MASFTRSEEEIIRLLRGGNGMATAELAALTARVRSLESDLRATQAAQTAAQETASLQNLLKNADFEHSFDSYEGSGGTDLAFWYRGIDTANKINGGTTPEWDDPAGWLELSTTADGDDLSYNFTQRTIKPGGVLYLQFIARLKDSSAANGFNLQAGIWDKTAGIDTWVAASIVGGGTSSPTVTKIGPGAAATNYGYKVAAFFEGGAVIVSDEGTVLGAAALNGTDFNRIAWASVPNATNYKVYRTTGGTLGMIAEINSGGSSYDDTGVTLLSGVAVPTSAPPQAKVVVGNFIAQLSSEWRTFRVLVQVPSGYNLGATAADGQWLRMGFKGTGTLPTVLLDRIALSTSPGAWSPNALDLATSADIVSAPVGSYDTPIYTDVPNYSYGDYLPH